MPRKKSSTGSIAQQVIDRVGFTRAVRVMVFIAGWGMCCDELGRPPVTVDEFAKWAKQDRSSAFRDQSDFRIATGLDTPTPIWEHYSVTGIFSGRDRFTASYAVGNLRAL